jgi:hypothetical protein
MVDFPWRVGGRLRFLVRAEAHGDKTAYAGWLHDERAGEWRHLVTFRTRNAGRLLRGLNSFVEDFRRDGRSVGEVRRSRFRAGWVRVAGGAWQPLAAARFTASRAAWEARDTINAGRAGDGYFLMTGGETRREAELGAALPGLAAAVEGPTDLPEAAFASERGAVPR